jgi:hypothetical protein
MTDFDLSTPTLDITYHLGELVIHCENGKCACSPKVSPARAARLQAAVKTGCDKTICWELSRVCTLHSWPVGCQPLGGP